MLVVGAKGFAKEIIEAIIDNDQSQEVVFYDNVNTLESNLLFGRFPILISAAEAREYLKKKDPRFVLGLAKPVFRQKLATEFISFGGVMHSVISKKASIGNFENTIGKGVCILQQTIIENSNCIGEGTLVHVGAFVSHDVVVGKFCEISPYVKLLGNVKIGNRVTIGTGAIILPGISIGDDAIIGAGSVVTKSVNTNEVVVGIPAKPISH